MSIEYTPKPYQLDAIEHLCRTPGAALFLDPGMGKTSSTLAAFTVLKEAGAVKRMLVVAPLRPCYKVWPEEIAKWADFNGLSYAIAHGKNKADALNGNADVVIINYEGLKWLETQPFPKDIDMLVLDESTKIKSTKAIRTDICTKLARRMKRTVILTGTPRPNSYADLFSQIRVLDGGVRLGQFITRFRLKYMIEDRHSNFSKWEIRPGADKEIQAAISDLCLTLSSKDHLDMPELIENVIKVDLPASADAVYSELETKFISELGTVTAANAAVLGMKLRQIVGGGVYADDGKAVEFETNKLEALVDLIEEQNGAPLLVAVGFLHEVKRINAALKKAGFDAAPYLGGGVSTVKSNKIIDDWKDGKIPVLLAHPTSVAHGLNLQAGGHSIVWYTLTWNLEEHIQFNARVWRQGQTSDHVVIHYLIAEGTIDEQVLGVLRKKDREQQKLINALKEYGRDKAKGKK